MNIVFGDAFVNKVRFLFNLRCKINFASISLTPTKKPLFYFSHAPRWGPSDATDVAHDPSTQCVLKLKWSHKRWSDNTQPCNAFWPVSNFRKKDTDGRTPTPSVTQLQADNDGPGGGWRHDVHKWTTGDSKTWAGRRHQFYTNIPTAIVLFCPESSLKTKKNKTENAAFCWLCRSARKNKPAGKPPNPIKPQRKPHGLKHFLLCTSYNVIEKCGWGTKLWKMWG